MIVAVGRRQNVQNLGLESLGVPLDKKGMPAVDPQTMRIGDTPVLQAGDANGMRAILHEGADDGHIAGLNAASAVPVRLVRRTAMSITFCTPEIAAVGKKVVELDLDDCLTGEVDFSSQGRARTMQENCGLLRLSGCRGAGIGLSSSGCERTNASALITRLTASRALRWRL